MNIPTGTHGISGTTSMQSTYYSASVPTMCASSLQSTKPKYMAVMATTDTRVACTRQPKALLQRMWLEQTCQHIHLFQGRWYPCKLGSSLSLQEICQCRPYLLTDLRTHTNHQPNHSTNSNRVRTPPHDVELQACNCFVLGLGFHPVVLAHLADNAVLLLRFLLDPLLDNLT